MIAGHPGAPLARYPAVQHYFLYRRQVLLWITTITITLTCFLTCRPSHPPCWMQWWFFERGRCMIYTMNDLWAAIYSSSFSPSSFEFVGVFISFFILFFIFVFVLSFIPFCLSFLCLGALSVSRAGDLRAIGGYRTSRGDCSCVGSFDSLLPCWFFLPDSWFHPFLQPILRPCPRNAL